MIISTAMRHPQMHEVQLESKVRAARRAVSALAVDGQLGRRTVPRRWRWVGGLLAAQELELARFVELDWLETRVGHALAQAADVVAVAEGVLGLGGLPDADQELALVVVERPLEAERKAEVAVRALVERAVQADAGLDTDQHAAPREFGRHGASVHGPLADDSPHAPGGSKAGVGLT